MTSPAFAAFEPRVALAMNVSSQPGVYGLLLGSGVSTGVGIPTGWGVVTELVRRVAAAAGHTVDADFDPEEWWAEHGGGEPLGYSGLLEKLASTSAARRALLAGFFEPSAEDREAGRKIPGPAHEAIAALVRRGSVRVILTTNFDRLIEQAIEAQNVFPQVISSAHAVAGMEPISHASCTVIKLHGDYASLDQLNTVEELSSYPAETEALLDRVLDEYGLVVSGWSGDWDHALVAAIERVKSRRYPLFWASRSALGAVAHRLVSQHRAIEISGTTADEFFPDLVSRLDALDQLADSPLTATMSLALLKRLLPDPTKHIQLRDLFEAHLQRIRHLLEIRPTRPASSDPAARADAHAELRRESDTLLQLLATGVYLDRDRQHGELWVWIVEQLLRARHTPDGQFVQWWDKLQHYPALLAMRTGCLAALAAKHEDVLVRLLREPDWGNPLRNGRANAVTALQDWNVLDHGILKAFQTQSWQYPASHLLRETLAPIFLPIVGDATAYQRLCSRVEYRIALAWTLFSSGGAGSRPAPGEFIGDFQWSDGELVWQRDFIVNADRVPWGFSYDNAGDMSNLLTKLADDLRPMAKGF